jgi:hypothetical protein
MTYKKCYLKIDFYYLKKYYDFFQLIKLIDTNYYNQSNNLPLVKIIVFFLFDNLFIKFDGLFFLFILHFVFISNERITSTSHTRHVCLYNNRIS